MTASVDEHPPCCVLIIEPSEESREVFRTVLQRRGLRTVDTGNADEGLQLAAQYQPGVIVLDLESPATDQQLMQEKYDEQSRERGASLVILGKAPRQGDGGCVVAKPYHFGPLIRTIEDLAKRAALSPRCE